jgi:hypothetical protein
VIVVISAPDKEESLPFLEATVEAVVDPPEAPAPTVAVYVVPEVSVIDDSADDPPPEVEP